MDRENAHSADLAASDAIGRYLQFVAHLDMPLSAKIEMIEALRFIVGSFVDRAWGHDSVQHVNETRAVADKPAPVVLGSATNSKASYARRFSETSNPAERGREDS